MRTSRSSARASVRVLLAALAVTAVAAACGSEGSSNTNTGGGSPSGSASSVAPANSVASSLVMGGPPECPQRPFCLAGLQSTYGLRFKEFKPLDAGGPVTVTALKNGDVQIALLFTSDGNIAASGFVLLEDDKKLQPSDNVTPVVNNDIAKAYGSGLADVVNAVSDKLTTQDLVDMNKAVTVDKRDADQVAREWLAKKSLLPSGTASAKTGPTIVVGSANFDESEILADMYAAALQANGYPIDKKLKVGSREVYFPSLTKGEIGLVPEYAGTLLTFVDKTQTPSTDPQKTYDALTKALQSQGVTAFKSAPAEDKNGFVVTKATADQYKLTKISDLAKPVS